MRKRRTFTEYEYYTCCKQCPSCYDYVDKKYHCGSVEGDGDMDKIIPDINSYPPEWCPLEDVK